MQAIILTSSHDDVSKSMSFRSRSKIAVVGLEAKDAMWMMVWLVGWRWVSAREKAVRRYLKTTQVVSRITHPLR